MGVAFIVSNCKKIKNNFTIVYVPQVNYKVTDDLEISLSLAIFDGKGVLKSRHPF